MPSLTVTYVSGLFVTDVSGSYLIEVGSIMVADYPINIKFGLDIL